MSIRWIGTRLFRHGQAYVRGLCRQYNTSNTIGDALKGGGRQVAAHSVSGSSSSASGFALRNVGVQVTLHARRILIDNVLSRVTNTLAADLRKKAAKRLLYGDSGTFLAFVGVSLASGTGILTKEEELEGVCYEIRDAISKLKWHNSDVDSNVSRFENEPISLADLTLGQVIDKGANAVVYAAKINDQKVAESNVTESEDAAESKIKKDHDVIEVDAVEFPLAVKMMFNYDIQSNSLAILKGMYRETIPARLYYSNTGEFNDWEMNFANRQRHLPPHPNIVAMFAVFTGFVPNLVGAATVYPAALPRRLNQDGFGRNMTLFLLMKRYSCTLHSYLQQRKSDDSINVRHSVLLFAQLLEGIAHLGGHGISHRDLKADNLLLDVSDGGAPPQLVISDFGLCLAEKSGSLLVPFNSEQVEKGGNSALMAPEILCAQPGTFSTLNYGRSDLWAAGAIAYELFGHPNPFYRRNIEQDANNSVVKRLTDKTYNMGDLPELPAHVPGAVRALIRSCLERNPNKRLDVEVAANVLQLYLWAPSSWLKPGLTKLPSSAEILQWLLTLTTKVLCEGRQQTSPVKVDSSAAHAQTSKVYFTNGRRTYPEYLLISTFLCRAKLYKIKSALKFIQNSLNDM